MKRATCLVTLCLAAILAPVATARTATVELSAHLHFNYGYNIDWTDTSDPECSSVTQGASRVTADITAVRPARFEVRTFGKQQYVFTKLLGGGQIDAEGIDMKVTEVRTTAGNQTLRSATESLCDGVTPFSTTGCGSRSWTLRGVPFVLKRREGGKRQLAISIEVTPQSEAEATADEQWRNAACGDDGDGDRYIITTENPLTRKVQAGYTAPLAPARLFSHPPHPFTITGTTRFTLGDPHGGTGIFTAIRTTTVRIHTL